MGINTAGLDQRVAAAIQHLARRIAELEDQLLMHRSLISQTHQSPLPVPEGSGNTMIVPPTVMSVSSNFTLSQEEAHGYLVITCTSACSMTLPTAFEGALLTVFNNGTANLTIKSGSTTTVCVLRPNSICVIRVLSDGSGLAAWPLSVPQTGADGVLYGTANIIVDSASVGVIQKDSGGHYWQTSFNTSGAMVTSDIGTTLPVFAEAVPAPS